MRVIVCGSRNARDPAPIFSMLDAIHAQTPIVMIIEGGQRTWENGKIVGGVDFFAMLWAISRKVDIRTVWAAWKTQGRGAGPIRNQKMIDHEHPDLVVAFQGGVGTADMVRRASKAGIKVVDG